MGKSSCYKNIKKARFPGPFLFPLSNPRPLASLGQFRFEIVLTADSVGIGLAAGQLDVAANSGCGVSKLICSKHYNAPYNPPLPRSGSTGEAGGVGGICWRPGWPPPRSGILRKPRFSQNSLECPHRTCGPRGIR